MRTRRQRGKSEAIGYGGGESCSEGRLSRVRGDDATIEVGRASLKVTRGE